MNKVRLAVWAHHPIQYQTGIWKRLHTIKKLDVTILFGDSFNTYPIWDHEFQNVVDLSKTLEFDYQYVFLKNLTFNNKNGFFRRVNPGLIWGLLSKKYDVVLLHGYDTITAWLTIMAAKATGVKVLFRGEANLRQDNHSWKQRLKRLLLTRLFHMVDAVLYSCTGNKEFFSYYGVPEEKLFLIPCAVDNDFFQEERAKWLPRRSETKAELGLSPDSFIILFAARWKPLKRPLDLLQAIKLLQDRGRTDIAAVFVGEGSERVRMEMFVQKHNLSNVRLIGFQDQTRISKYYAIGDVGVVLSDYDPSPKAMNEMMNFAMPIICTDVVGTARDLVHEGENGFIVNVGDVEAVADHIQYLAEHREIARRMGERSLEIVSEWNFDRDVEAIEAAVEYAMGRK